MEEKDSTQKKFTVLLSIDEIEKYEIIQTELKHSTKAKTFRNLLDIYDRYKSLILENRKLKEQLVVSNATNQKIKRSIENYMNSFEGLKKIAGNED